MLNENTTTIIDYASALERIGGDREFLNELLTIYVEEFDSSALALDQALQAQDYTVIQEVGHSLKGSSANLSLLQLRDKAYQIETAGREENLELARSSAEELKQEFRRLQEHLDGAA
jgi:two-component system sensor histidine kinase/response regulator